MLVKQSTATNLLVLMVSATDHISGLAGLTLTITASKDGAGFASITPVVTDLGSGWYSLALTTTHTNTLNALALHITSTGADPTDSLNQVVADLPGASVSSVSGAVGSVTGNVGGNVVGTVASVVGAVGSVTAVVSANLTQILGTALTETAGQIAAAFKQFFNISSPTSTMNRVTLVDTVTTYTGNTPQTGDNYARLGAPAGASIAADLAEIEAETDGIAAIPTNPLLTTDARLNHLDADVSSRLATSSYTAPDNSDIAAIKAKTDNLPVDPASESLIIAATNSIKTDVDAIPTNPLLATDARLNHLDADISSRLATSGYTAPLNSSITAIKAKTDNLPATPAAQSDVTTVGTAVAAVPGAVWDVAISGHQTSGTTGKDLSDAAAGGGGGGGGSSSSTNPVAYSEGPTDAVAFAQEPTNTVAFPQDITNAIAESKGS